MIIRKVRRKRDQCQFMKLDNVQNSYVYRNKRKTRKADLIGLEMNMFMEPISLYIYSIRTVIIISITINRRSIFPFCFFLKLICLFQCRISSKQTRLGLQ